MEHCKQSCELEHVWFKIALYPGSELCLPDPWLLQTMKCDDLKISRPGEMGRNLQVAQRFSQEHGCACGEKESTRLLTASWCQCSCL